MIDWNEVYNAIKGYVEDASYYQIDRPKAIFKYFKSLIAKEFKLVASGKVEAGSRNLIFLYEELGNNKCAFHNVSEILKKLDNKNISIYISENESGDKNERNKLC